MVVHGWDAIDGVQQQREGERVAVVRLHGRALQCRLEGMDGAIDKAG